MTLFHAIAFVDHHCAEILQFDSEHVVKRKVHEHTNGVGSERAFFGEVCDVLDGIAEVLVAGEDAELADFHVYVDQHRPLTTKRIVKYEVVDSPSEKQLVALARKYFLTQDHMCCPPIHHVVTKLLFEHDFSYPKDSLCPKVSTV